VNPAWEIARGLPPFIRHPKLDSTSDVSSIASNPPIRLLLHPEQVKVSYTTVRELVPKLWDGRKIDYAVHIGMATGRKYYSVERRAHRDGYAMKDVDEQFLGDAERKKEEGDKWIWHGLPEEFLTSADIDDVWKRWRIALPVCASLHIAPQRC
jgi:pyroglutamyl-peptidase